MWTNLIDHANQGELVQQICRPECDPVEKMLDPPVIRRTEPPDDPGDLIALLQEELGKVRAVLPEIPVIIARFDIGKGF